jgi:hypothetical protein
MPSRKAARARRLARRELRSGKVRSGVGDAEAKAARAAARADQLS